MSILTKGDLISASLTTFGATVDPSNYITLTGYFAAALFIITVIVTVILPGLFSFEAPLKRRIIGAVCCGALIIIFWRWIMYEALSDLWAMFFAFLAVYLAKKAHTIRQTAPVLLLCFMAGICAYAAYNIRTIFLFFAWALCAGIIVSNALTRKTPKVFIASIVVLAMGFAALGMTQAVTNHSVYGGHSIMVHTSVLFRQQLFWGLNIERYDSVLHPETFGGMKFTYAPGAILADTVPELAQTGVMSTGTLIKLFLRRPLDMTVIYIRHLLNMLTVLHPYVFIPDSSVSSKGLYAVGSIMLWIIGIIAFAQKRFSEIRLKTFDNIWFVILMIPVIAILPGAIEGRFGLTAFMLLYGYLCYAVDYKELMSFIKRNKVMVGLCSFTLFFLWITVIASTLSSVGFLLL